MWLPVVVAALCIALSALEFMLLPPLWETSLFWKLIPAITGVFVLMFGLVQDIPLGTPFPSDTKYFFALLFGVNAGLINYTVESAPIFLRTLAWAVSLAILTVWPWVSSMRMFTAFVTRFTLTVFTASLLTFVIMVMAGVPPDVGLGVLWLAFIAAMFTWYMYWSQHKTVLVFIGALGLVAHMAHAILVFTPMTALDDFYTALPILIFYASVPAFTFYKFKAQSVPEDKEYSLYDTE